MEIIFGHFLMSVNTYQGLHLTDLLRIKFALLIHQNVLSHPHILEATFRLCAWRRKSVLIEEVATHLIKFHTVISVLKLQISFLIIPDVVGSGVIYASAPCSCTEILFPGKHSVSSFS